MSTPDFCYYFQNFFESKLPPKKDRSTLKSKNKNRSTEEGSPLKLNIPTWPLVLATTSKFYASNLKITLSKVPGRKQAMKNLISLRWIPHFSNNRMYPPFTRFSVIVKHSKSGTEITEEPLYICFYTPGKSYERRPLSSNISADKKLRRNDGRLFTYLSCYSSLSETYIDQASTVEKTSIVKSFRQPNHISTVKIF